MNSLKQFSYPKQYILKENEGVKIYRTLSNMSDYKEIDEYMYGVVSVIQQKEMDGELFSQIQYDDQNIGWIHFENSIQIFRFKDSSVRFLDKDFITSQINKNMGLEKDFRTHFMNKLVTAKSEITYNGERLLGIFIKDKFFGFHPVKYFEKMVRSNIALSHNEVNNIELFSYSSMQTPIKNKIEIDNPYIAFTFKGNKIGRIKVNKKDFYWIKLDEVNEKFNSFEPEFINERTEEQKYLDDIFYSINVERNKSKELVKTVLEAKKYLKTKKEKEKDTKMKHLRSSFLNAREKRDNYAKQVEKLEIEVNRLKNSNKAFIENEEALKNDKHTKNPQSSSSNEEKQEIFYKNELDKMIKKNKKIQKQLNLSEKRLEDQKDYSKRLEHQKNKYRNRMVEVENKLKRLLSKTKKEN